MMNHVEYRNICLLSQDRRLTAPQREALDRVLRNGQMGRLTDMDVAEIALIRAAVAAAHYRQPPPDAPPPMAA